MDKIPSKSLPLKAQTPEISGFGLRYADVVSSVAKRDKGSLSETMRILPQGMRHIRRSIYGLTDMSVPLEHASYRSITIHESESWRLGIVRLGPAGKIPLHDHPNAFSVCHVLAGEIKIDAFSSTRHLHGMIRLNRAWTADIGPEQSAAFDPWSINIHRLEASKKGAVVLSGIFANGTRIENRHWFFSLGQGDDNTMEATMVASESIHSKTRHSCASLPRFSGFSDHNEHGADRGRSCSATPLSALRSR